MKSQLDLWFATHPVSEQQQETIDTINQRARELVEVLLKLCPPSAERYDAIKQIRGAALLAIASTTYNDK